MAFDAFLNINGIKGESQDSKHKGEIDVLGFKFGASQTGTFASGGGGGAGKGQVDDLRVTKKIDSSSPLLFLNCLSGAHLKDATLTVRKAGGQQLEYLKIKLTDVLISNVKPHGNAEQNEVYHDAEGKNIGGYVKDRTPGAISTYGDEIPLEELSLNFAKIEYTYQPQGSNGQAQGGPIVAGWDVKGNQKV